MASPSDQTRAVGTLPQATRRDFSGVGYDEAMRRAREIVPILRERAQAAEDARVLIRDNEQLLHETGLFRFHQPKAFGGMELDFVAVVDIPAEIARGCPSTAWNVGNLGCHHWILGYYDPETQHEVWDANPDALIASSIALAAGRGAQGRRRVHRQRPLAVLLRRRQLRLEHAGRHRLRRRRQDGRSTGGCAWCPSPTTRSSTPGTPWAWSATGSKDIAVTELFVPERRALALQRCRGGPRASGRRAHARPALPHPDRGRLRPSAGARGGRRGRGRLRAVPRLDGQAHGHLHRRQGRRLPGRADQGRPRALPDRFRPHAAAPVGHRASRRRGAQRGAGPADQAALPRAVGLRRQPGARGGGDAVVVLRRAGPLHARSPAAAPARRAWP